MTHINNTDDASGFRRRVSFAASVIGSGRETTRSFDSCFENFDGDAVALALYQRTLKNPGTKLAANIWKYLGKDSVEALPAKYPGMSPAEVSAQILQRERAVKAACTAYCQDLKACPTYQDGTPRKTWWQLDQLERETWIKNPTPRTYRTELTPTGEQTVIPGCERDASPRAAQLDLF
jgi:hypothetical protein